MIFQIKSENSQYTFGLLRRFSRFTAVGLVSAIGHYGVLIALVQILGIGPIAASVPAAVIGAFINYILNYRYTFQSSKRHRESVKKFAIIAAAGVLLNTLFMWIGVDLFHTHYLIVQIATTALVLVWSFSANHWWTFRAI